MPDTDVLDRLERTAVRTDADVVDLVVALLDAPVRRQCWVLFLGERGLPVHLVMPVADLPYEPDDRVPDFGALVEDVVAQVGAAQVVLAWERPGGERAVPRRLGVGRRDGLHPRRARRPAARAGRRARGRGVDDRARRRRTRRLGRLT
ncbi:hypothetical protein [Curtobacterium sp. MCJR17_043]|uniref:hypothetical protein n=1 Tax=Curtobacterium sp. MCJR17_043 TaxID=2175660 RepID=UPI0024DF5706|nr:hypothetical protein [Curtobacterium sp. MCJR17_043]WIB36975.1 hypothetical protein DEJ15_08550 [Curtobacterium sp. MCJR17_043]